MTFIHWFHIYYNQKKKTSQCSFNSASVSLASVITEPAKVIIKPLYETFTLRQNWHPRDRTSSQVHCIFIFAYTDFFYFSEGGPHFIPSASVLAKLLGFTQITHSKHFGLRTVSLRKSRQLQCLAPVCAPLWQPMTFPRHCFWEPWPQHRANTSINTSTNKYHIM